MLTSRFTRIALIGLIVLAGIWLLSTVATPAAEGIAHQRAVAAFAPVSGDRALAQSPGAPAEGAVSPVEVHLADIPAGELDPNNQLARWQRGEIDLDENESILSEAEMAALRAEAMNLEPSANIQQAAEASGPGALAPSAGVAFDSLDYTECCGGGGNVPPDPELAVGPNHVIAVVNVAFEIYDKAGNSLVGPTTFASFMASSPSCTGVFDPNAIYDESADRFILGIDADGSAYCVAVSQTGNPLGSWNLYAFPTGSNFFDYPHAGVGQDAIYMGANMFSCLGPFGCTFSEGRVWAFDKQAMYNGQSASYVTRGLPTSEDTPQPLHLHGYDQGTWPSSGPHYFFTNTNFNGETYSVWTWDNPFGANTLTQINTVNLESYTGVSAGMPVDVVQSGSSARLQANDFRPQDFEYRNGFGWSVQTIACNPGGGTVDCIRWAQIDLSDGSIADAGVYASSGNYRFFGDLAVNHCDDMAVGYTRSSSSMFPAVWVTGRQSGDPAGVLQAEAQLKAGEITYTAFDGSPHRWGDYTGMTIDPNGETFWYLGQYSKNTGTTNGRWGTYIGSFNYSCDVGGDPTPTPTPTNTLVPPTATNTPQPSATATSTNTPVPPTATATPTNTLVPPTATNTPQPSATATPTNTPVPPTATATPTNTPVPPTATATPTSTPVPPTATATPTNTPVPPTATATPTNTPVPPTSTPLPTATATPGSGNTMHIADLDGATRGYGPVWWAANASFTVVDANGNVVKDATVYGQWSGGVSASAQCTTRGNGLCAVSIGRVGTSINSVTFTITNIIHDSLVYNPAANSDPDGDSDGTTITIVRP